MAPVTSPIVGGSDVMARAVRAFCLVAVAAITGIMVTEPAFVGLAIASTGAGVLALGALRAPRSALLALIAWLAVLGLVRRLVADTSPPTPLGDPLLLIAAVTWVALAVRSVRSGSLSSRTPLTTAVLMLMGALAMSAANPLQGGLMVGLGGVFLSVVPMLAFLIGRTVVDDRTLRHVILLIIALAVTSACYGLYQTFLGFPPWDESWIARSGVTSLNVLGATRSFGPFSAASEYAQFLGVGIVGCVALRTERLRRIIGILLFGVLVVALWYVSSRGAVVMTVAAVGLVFAARRGLSLWLALLTGAAVVALLPFGVSQLAPETFDTEATSQLVQHQVEGLTDPFGEESTLSLHIDLVLSGLHEATVNPLGRGVGATTIAGAKYGENPLSAEADPGNVAISVGVVGVVLYACVVIIGFKRLYDLASARRDAVSLFALAVFVVTFQQWLNGGQYAVIALPWLVLGWADQAKVHSITPAAARKPIAAAVGRAI